MKQAVIYIRTSGESQVEREGPEVQEANCRRYAERWGIEVVDVLHEAATTGTTDDRPVLAEALVMIERGEANLLLFSSMDRLARKLTVQEALLGRAWGIGAEVHSADSGPVLEDDPDDPMRTAMRQMRGVFAQLDRGMTVARLKKARDLKRARGEKASGSYPYGHSKQGPIPAEQEVLTRVRRWREKGQTWGDIAAMLNFEGVRPRTAAKWTAPNVAKIAR